MRSFQHGDNCCVDIQTPEHANDGNGHRQATRMPKNRSGDARGAHITLAKRHGVALSPDRLELQTQRMRVYGRPRSQGWERPREAHVNPFVRELGQEHFAQSRGMKRDRLASWSRDPEEMRTVDAPDVASMVSIDSPQDRGLSRDLDKMLENGPFIQVGGLFEPLSGHRHKMGPEPIAVSGLVSIDESRSDE
jgi:hypothetical protein